MTASVDEPTADLERDDPLRAMLAGDPLPAALTVVDAHAHLGPYSLFFIPHPDVDAIVRVMDRTGVAAAVLSANQSIQHNARAGNQQTLAAVQCHPTRLAGYGVVNVWQSPEAELGWIVEQDGFIGIKVHPDLHEYPLDGAGYEPVWECAAATGLPVLTHTWNTSCYDDPRHADRVLQRHPEVTLILGHSGVSPAGVLSSIEVARRHPNAILEICGSQLTAPLLELMVARVGSRQVMFGSDFPFIDQRCSLGRVVGSDLALDDMREVLSGTANRTFRRRWDSAATPKARRTHGQ